MTVSKSDRRYVYDRASSCCEYCRLPASEGTVAFHVDHIIPIRHNGADTVDNLCLACAKCNTYKGYNISGFDPMTEALTPLYHPREQQWDEHFEIQPGMQIDGRTKIGRTTAHVLQMNDEDRVEHRKILSELGVYPCQS